MSRVAALVDAEERAEALFDEVVSRGLIAPGRSERDVSDAIQELAAERYGVERYWHKRIVRAGANTLEVFRKNPPDRTLGDDDIVFLDFGPIFAAWEADFGRTYVLGDDPEKAALRDALETVWLAGRAAFDADPDVTGEGLYDVVCDLAADAGYLFGGEIAGHLVGDFPHERIPGDKIASYIAPGSKTRLHDHVVGGNPAHWILEVHLLDRDRRFGGFYEQLLDIRRDQPVGRPLHGD
ncbi:M24 family metallopeptidase [Tsukamurella sp. 8F]|uniref:M24 family metallopeptidase n=1 Tax=unclassified Tsukamurella TaxID=2633480 RepID=UPI0023B89B47|nr:MULTISPECIES: M24 family metallopeptidase [unclassified Tsukamurella]MDF0528773.1 M24 family metallopeptidase [Tsukamurella sp. 8J]MDF0586608.1 M24 family metallopeptidase [Tsukamurella sp. 8F]